MSCVPAGRWRSYFTSGSSAIYLFLYSAFYFYTKLDITKASQLSLTSVLLAHAHACSLCPGPPPPA